MTPAEAIEKALREHAKLKLTRTTIENAQRGWPIYLSGGERADIARIALDALRDSGMVVGPAEDQQAMLGLLKELSDPEPCWFDHDGGCQAHGPTSTWPRCPHAHAHEMLAALPERTENA